MNYSGLPTADEISRLSYGDAIQLQGRLNNMSDLLQDEVNALNVQLADLYRIVEAEKRSSSGSLSPEQLRYAEYLAGFSAPLQRHQNDNDLVHGAAIADLVRAEAQAQQHRLVELEFSGPHDNLQSPQPPPPPPPSPSEQLIPSTFIYDDDPLLSDTFMQDDDPFFADTYNQENDRLFSDTTEEDDALFSDPFNQEDTQLFPDILPDEDEDDRLFPDIVRREGRMFIVGGDPSDSDSTVVGPSQPSFSYQAPDVGDSMVASPSQPSFSYRAPDAGDSVVAHPHQPVAHQQDPAREEPNPEKFECKACHGHFRPVNATRLLCRHWYCNDCLRIFILRGIIDRDLTLLPPRCCYTKVPDDIIITILGPDELAIFREAETERNTRDKTYCTKAGCGRFIAPAYIFDNEAICRFCGTQSCAACKQTAHDGTCTPDPTLEPTLNLGDQLHWRRCYSCHSMVSIDSGCNHMICICGAEFCYNCGEEWGPPRECSCAFWIEDAYIIEGVN